MDNKDSLYKDRLDNYYKDKRECYHMDSMDCYDGEGMDHYYMDIKENYIKDESFPVMRWLTSFILAVYCISTCHGQFTNYGQFVYTSGQTTYYKEEGGTTFHRTPAQKGVKLSTDIILIGLPVATLAGVIIEHDWEGLKQGALSVGTAFGATMILKYAVREKRPDGSNYHSFPSGHTSITFSTATFLQRRYGWKLGVPAYVLAAYTGWGRIYAKKHHWWDVLTGAAIGTGASLIYTRPFAKKHELVIEPMTTPECVNVTASLVF